MTTPTFVRNPRLHGAVGAIVGVAALGCLFAATAARADAPTVTVAIHVNAHGLDLTQEEGVRKFYQRIKSAAWAACTHGERVGLSPVDDPMACADHSLTNAIRSVSAPALTRIYLETHTLKQAAVAGISVPLAARTQ
jgi:UrcA family protein